MTKRPHERPDDNQRPGIRSLASIAEPFSQQLARSITPLLDSSAYSTVLLAPLRAHVASLFDSPGFRELIAQWRESLPPNWSENERTDHVADFTSQTAVCLVWVPRAATLRALLVSEEPFQTLVDHSSEIIEDIDSCLSEVRLNELAEATEFARKACNAYPHHPEAAQALAATTLTTVIHRHLGMKRLAEVQAKFSDWETAPFWQVRLALVGLAVAKALEPNSPENGDPPPSPFNRHAAIHGVSLAQYTDANCLSALMALTALLRELQELLAHDGTSSSG